MSRKADDDDSGEDEGTDTSGWTPSPKNWSGIEASLLNNPNRSKIVEKIRQMPGLNKNQLSNELDFQRNLVDYHIERLEEHSMVVTRPGARGNETLCFMRSDHELWEDEELRIMFGGRSTRQIGLFITEHPGAEVHEIAAAVDLSRVTVRHHLDTLQEYDMVHRVSVGRGYAYHPTSLLNEWDDLVGDAFPRSWETDGEADPEQPPQQ